MWIFLELFDGIQVGGLSSYLVSLSTLSNDFSQCQIFSSALGALVTFGPRGPARSECSCNRPGQAFPRDHYCNFQNVTLPF